MALALESGIFIVAAKRTPFGAFGGRLSRTNASELQAAANVAALAAGGVAPDRVDSTVIGHVRIYTSPDGIFMPRHSALKAGIPKERPAYGINRLCGSGFQAVVSGAHSILTGDSEIVLTGGTETMSASPFCVRNIRFGRALGEPCKFEDALWAGFTDTYCNTPMGGTAENLAEMYKLSREEVDQFAFRSQINWKKAQEAGRFKEELAPVTVKTSKGKEDVVTVDEHPRPNTTLEGLAKLPAVFRKGGIVTAGSSSGICDGAGAVIVASEKAVRERGLKPLARLVGYSVVGVEPHIMGIGPAPAIKKLLRVTGKTLNDIDLIEINEAFGAQVLACMRELNFDMEKLNVDGGAIAIGHPLGASGARITAHLVHELKRRRAKYGIGSACIGGGQGIALLLESTP